MRLMRTVLWLWVLTLIACAPAYTVKSPYSSAKPDGDAVVLRIDPHVMVLRVDDVQESLPGGGRKAIAHSAGVRRDALSLPVGSHQIEASFTFLCLRSNGTQVVTFRAEPGKVYRLKSEVTDYKQWRASIIEDTGELVPDSLSVAKGMCAGALPNGMIWLPAWR